MWDYNNVLGECNREGNKVLIFYVILMCAVFYLLYYCLSLLLLSILLYKDQSNVNLVALHV